MCGIAGISRSNRSKLTDEQVKIIMSILISRMDDRGGDSFGYYTNGSIVKGVGTAAFSVQLDAIKGAQSLFLHTRKATVGNVTKANAHPWRINNLVGCHNGSVSNHHEMNHKYNRNFDVDSMHIFAHYSQDLPLSELRAHGAIAFVDELFRKDVIYAGRFNDGLLTIVGIGPKDEPSEDVVFCSLGPAIKSALDMAKVEHYRSYTVEGGHLYQIQDGQCLYNIPNTKLAFSSRTLLEVRREYDLSIPDWTFRQSAEAKKEEPKEKKIVVGTPFERPRIDQVYPPRTKPKDMASIKAFVRKREGLEAWYKTGWCFHCEIEPATVRVPCTDLLYCHECWIHFEKIAPFMLLKEEHVIFFPPEPVSTMDRVEDEPEEKSDLCERCTSAPAVWFVPKQDISLCNDCRVNSGFTLAEIVSMNERDIINETVTPGGEWEPLGNSSSYPEAPEAKECMFGCGRSGAAWWRSEDLNRHMWVCMICFQREHQSEVQGQFDKIVGSEAGVVVPFPRTGLRPIRIGFSARQHLTQSGKISARKPEPIDRSEIIH